MTAKKARVKRSNKPREDGEYGNNENREKRPRQKKNPLIGGRNDWKKY